MASTITLNHAERYIGTPYLPGAFDCADLAAKVQWELFGRVVGLPQARLRSEGAHVQGQQITALRADLAERIAEPVTGCAVLLYTPMGDGPDSAAQMWHIGTVFVELQGSRAGTWVLHNSAKLNSAWLHRLEALQRFGMRVEGFYAWRAAGA